MAGAITLMTERLILREFVENDWRAVHEYASDPEVFRFRAPEANATETQTREQVREIVLRRGQQPRTEWFLALVLRADGRLIGECFLRRLGGEEAAFLGYSLNRQFWGQSYTTEAASVLIDFGLRTLGLDYIEAGCHPDNVGSRRVMEKIGMRREECPYEYHPGKAGSPPGLYYRVYPDPITHGSETG